MTREGWHMAEEHSGKKVNRGGKAIPLMVRLDPESKVILSQAAKLRRISVSDYVRVVAVAQARKEVLAAGEPVISLTPDEQLAFQNASCSSGVREMTGSPAASTSLRAWATATTRT